jgi:hypothetical protein
MRFSRLSELFGTRRGYPEDNYDVRSVVPVGPPVVNQPAGLVERLRSLRATYLHFSAVISDFVGHAGRQRSTVRFRSSLAT